MMGKSRHKKRSGKLLPKHGAGVTLRRPVEHPGEVASGTSFGTSNPSTSRLDGTGDPDATPDSFRVAPASGSVGQSTPDPLANYPIGLDKVYFRTKSGGEETLEQALEVPLQHEPQLRQILHGQLVEQAGGQQNVTPTMAGLVSTIVEQRILETKINRALAKHGTLRVNNKTGRVTGQAIIKDLLLPLQSALRLNLKTYADECARLTNGGRPPANGDDWMGREFPDKSPKEALDEITLLTDGRTYTVEEVKMELQTKYPEEWAKVQAEAERLA